MAKTAHYLRRYKAFRELERRAKCLAEQLEQAEADLEQAKDEMEWADSGRRLGLQRRKSAGVACMPHSGDGTGYQPGCPRCANVTHMCGTEPAAPVMDDGVWG